MPLVVPNAAEAIMLANVLNKTAPETLILRLYKNDVTPGEDDDETTYEQADFSGYAAVTLTGANWTITPGAPSSASYAQQTFTSDAAQAAQAIYGYYVIETTSGALKWAERFGSPATMTNDGDQIKVTPVFTLE
jgi:hypothetical protein